MTVTLKYTSSGAAGAEVDARATRYMTEKGCDYREAVHATLAADKQLAESYAAPAVRRRGTMATVDPRSQPAIPVIGGEEREIIDWISRAVKDGMASAISGALGSLAIQASAFVRLGMDIEEAVRRVLDGNPHLRDLAGIQVRDIRRNAPWMPTGETAAAQAPGDIVHMRAKALTEKQHMDYHEAMGAVLAEDPALKTSYAGT